MDAVELRRREREILESRRLVQLSERRAQRRKQLQQVVASGGGCALLATTLTDVEAVTKRPGFLREQLKLPTLTPLKRWHLQLQLLEAEDCKPLQTGDDDVDSALRACATALAQDKKCFDVVYRHGARVADAQGALLDESAPINVRELLSFSTRCNGLVCRVTCVNDGKQVAFNCSEFVDNLQTQLQLLLSKDDVSLAISFIHDTLNQQQQKQ